MVVENDGIALTTTLAEAAEAGPDRGDSKWPQDRRTGHLIKDLIAFVHTLNVLSRPDGAVGIGRRATAYDTWEWDTVKIEDGRGHNLRNQASQHTMIDNRIGGVDMIKQGYLRIQIRFAQFTVLQRLGRPDYGKIAQRG